MSVVQMNVAQIEAMKRKSLNDNQKQEEVKDADK